ncbi:FG-GAP repeat domain-containing protein [Streptomyces sp. NPDC050085]|uniref:FG-GAP repeat domain-containing protein n=1 Tax=Streptomyces sp. NPDC050085 TaxID=3365600 RepID=UPI0037990A13
MTLVVRNRTLKALFTTAAATVALAATAGSSLAAGDPSGATEAHDRAGHRAQAPLAAPRAAAVAKAAPKFSMTAVHKTTGELYLYWPDGKGGFEPREDVGVTYDFQAADIPVDNDDDVYSDGTYHLRKNGVITYAYIDDGSVYHSTQVGYGWNIYSTVLSVGTIAGAKEADLLAVDKSGVLWEYLAYPDGTLTKRSRIGGGWGQYTQLAGQGDLTGDGRADLVARDKSGVLWLYRGTGDFKAPFAARTQIGAGWNTYDRLLSVGDLDSDGKSDLVARKANGDLYRYSGTGVAPAVWAKAVKIGYGFQVYNLL